VAGPARLLRRVLSDRIRRRIAHARRLVRGFLVRRLISMLALLISPLVFVSVNISRIPAAHAPALKVLRALCRIPVFIAYPQRALARLLQQQGYVDEVARIRMHIARHRFDRTSLRLANTAFSLAVAHDRAGTPWQANLPRPAAPNPL